MQIDELLKLTRQYINTTQDKPSLIISNDWAQGRTVYGGLSAALVYAAIKEKVSTDRVLRSLTCNFVGPLRTGEPFDISVELLRQGKNATQVLARTMQDEKICLVVQACFGVPRTSKIKVENNDRHKMPIPTKAKFLPQIPKITPKFLKHIDLAINEGGLPFTGSKLSHMHGWMRYTNAPSEVTDAHLIALMDAWPAAPLQMLRWPAPASSMSWNIEFLHPHSVFQPTEWFAYQALTRQAADGYGHTEANIWDAKGKLIALSRQTVAIFD